MWPAKPGHPVVLSSRAMAISWRARVSRFKGITADGTGLVALSYRGYAGSSGSPSEHGLLQDAAALMPLPSPAMIPAVRRLGFFARHGVAVAVAASIGSES